MAARFKLYTRGDILKVRIENDCLIVSNDWEGDVNWTKGAGKHPARISRAIEHWRSNTRQSAIYLIGDS